jgi:hypothetical protein
VIASPAPLGDGKFYGSGPAGTPGVKGQTHF